MAGWMDGRDQQKLMSSPDYTQPSLDKLNQELAEKFDIEVGRGYKEGVGCARSRSCRDCGVICQIGSVK